MTTTEKRRGVIKWFDRLKRFGFVQVDGEADEAFLHFSCLQEVDVRSALKGSLVEVELERGEKGLAVKRLVSIVPPALPDNVETVEGRVKWYDTKRGFGFVVIDGDRDVFVHATVVRQSALHDLQTDQRVVVEVLARGEGLRAISICAAPKDSAAPAAAE